MIAEMFLPEYDQEMASTRKLLAALPETITSWKPHEKSMDIQHLAGHVAELPGWAVHTITKDVLDITPPPGQTFTGKLAASREDLLAYFNQQAAEGRKAIAGASDEHLGKPWSLVYGGTTIFTMPRAAVLRSFMMNHLIHHRAQLGVYLRLLNRPIPGMYGPSADDPNPFAASMREDRR